MEHIRFRYTADNLVTLAEVARIVALATYYNCETKVDADPDNRERFAVTAEGGPTNPTQAAEALLVLSSANYGKAATGIDKLSERVEKTYEHVISNVAGLLTNQSN